jgi:transposase
MVLDQAGWHGAKALKVPETVTLVPLPPSSPDLNPVERVWLYLRERYLSHRLLAAPGSWPSRELRRPSTQATILFTFAGGASWSF